MRARTADTMFAYSCAQSVDREHKAKASRGENGRDARRMPRFACGGWLYVAISDESDMAASEVKVKHEEDHLAYFNAELPEKWRTYIEENARTQTPGTVS